MGVTPLEEVMEEEIWEVGLELMEAYVLRRKNTVIQYYLLWTYVRKWFRGRGRASINSDGKIRG